MSSCLRPSVLMLVVIRLSEFWAFLLVLFVCVEKFSLGSKVKPRMVGLEMVGVGVLLM